MKRMKLTFSDLENYVNEYKRNLLNLGYALRHVKTTYKDLVGEGINTWADFVSQSEIGLTVREANDYIRLANLIDGIDVPLEDLNLATARFCSLKGITDPSLIDDMKVLTLKDFKERHYDVVKRQDNAPRTYKYMVMKRCNETGNLSKVYGEEIQKIEEDLDNNLEG